MFASSPIGVVPCCARLAAVGSREKGCLEAFAEEREQLLKRFESHLVPGIDLLDRTFKVALDRSCFRSQPKYESAPHDVPSLRTVSEQCVTYRWLSCHVLVTRVLKCGLGATSFLGDIHPKEFRAKKSPDYKSGRLVNVR